MTIEVPDTDLSKNPKIWATLITNDKYMPGLLTLDYSLRKVGTKYPIVALYTDQLSDESIEALLSRKIAMRKIDQLLPAESPELTADPRFQDCWSKLYIFKLVEFDRIIELDSDMVVMQNMDELMDLPLGDKVFASAPACVCNPFKRSHYPADWVPENCSFTDYQGKKKLSLNPQDNCYHYKGPDSSLGLGQCNSGLIVIEPKLQYYDKVLETLKDPVRTSKYKFPDQELLTDVFPWLSLSYVYNCLKSLRSCHSDIWDMTQIKNIHYILTPKPWQVSEDTYDDPTGTFQYWWDANDERIAQEKAVGINDTYH